MRVACTVLDAAHSVISVLDWLIGFFACLGDVCICYQSWRSLLPTTIVLIGSCNAMCWALYSLRPQVSLLLTGSRSHHSWGPRAGA